MKRWLTTAVLTGVLSVACTASQGDKYPTYDTMCDDVAAHECQVAGRCVVSADACKTARKKVCLDGAAAAIQAGRRYTAARAEDCVNKSKETYALTSITPTDKGTLDDVCQRVYAGSADKGGTCKTSYDCSGSLVCDKGHCGEKTEKKKGDGCANPGEVCEAGTFCQTQADVKICAAKKAKGDACDATTPCLEDLRCNTMCTDRLGVGAQCASDADCSASAPYCDEAANKICTPGLSFAVGSPDCRAYGAT